MLAACSSGSSSSAPPATSGGGSTGSTTTAVVKNLVISTGVRSQLVAAGAALHKLPATDYTGLIVGETYYAYDPATKTYWAGAGLVASSTSIQAQIGDQDDGAYLVFDRPAGGSWRAYDAGIPGDSHFACGMTVPAAVVAAWHWAPGTCHPRSG
jgi:hypothetical protein